MASDFLSPEALKQKIADEAAAKAAVEAQKIEVEKQAAAEKALEIQRQGERKARELMTPEFIDGVRAKIKTVIETAARCQPGQQIMLPELSARLYHSQDRDRQFQSYGYQDKEGGFTARLVKRDEWDEPQKFDYEAPGIKEAWRLIFEQLKIELEPLGYKMTFDPATEFTGESEEQMGFGLDGWSQTHYYSLGKGFTVWVEWK
jgi:hypothetical protein